MSTITAMRTQPVVRHITTASLLAVALFMQPLMAYAQQDTAQPELVNPEADDQSAFSHTLTNINFHRSSDEGAKVVLSFDQANVDVAVVRKASSVTLTLPNTELGEEQLYQLDVTDFGTPVSMIETFQDAQQSRVVFELDHPVRVREQTNGKVMTLDLVAEQPTDDTEAVQSDYEGAPISLDFQDVPVRQVLQIIAQVNGFNLVTTDTVTGNVTVSLTDVPWDQALNMIMKIKGLGKREEGNILLIAPAEELAQRETQRLQSERQVEELAPLKNRTIQINFAKASNIAKILKSEEGGILSERGSVTVDDRTNSVLIRDTEESIYEAQDMVKQLDIPVKQVLIESRMVTVRDTVSEQLGIRWGFSDQQGSDGISGSLEGAQTIGGGVIPSLNDRLNVNLPVSNPAGSIGFQIAKLADGTILDLELSALEQEDKGEIIASPRITVANQHQAYIEQGTEIPYVQSTSSGATSVEFKKAVLSLKVTPHITPDKRIILDLVVTQDTRGDTVSTSTGPAVAIDTQEIATQVLVENGETVVLGGIFQQNKINTINKVPLFGDLPLVGNMFRNKQDRNEKRELLIFVTPKVISESVMTQGTRH